MSEHELTEEKIGELWDASQDKATFFDDLGLHSKNLFSSFARDAYDLGRQASAADSGGGWTDDELRAAIDAASRAAGYSISIDHKFEGSTDTVANYAVTDLRHLLTALGIDHQPKPELPTKPGSIVYDAVVGGGADRCAVMSLHRFGYWIGVGALGATVEAPGDRITSFGGVLDLDKVRGEQGE